MHDWKVRREEELGKMEKIRVLRRVIGKNGGGGGGWVVAVGERKIGGAQAAYNAPG